MVRIDRPASYVYLTQAATSFGSWQNIIQRGPLQLVPRANLKKLFSKEFDWTYLPFYCYSQPQKENSKWYPRDSLPTRHHFSLFQLNRHSLSISSEPITIAAFPHLAYCFDRLLYNSALSLFSSRQINLTSGAYISLKEPYSPHCVPSSCRPQKSLLTFNYLNIFSRQQQSLFTLRIQPSQ
jgi:hypothetical protein